MRIQLTPFAVVFCLASLTPRVQGKKDLVWSEEFNANGAPEPGTWSYDIGHNNGWGNYELQTYTDDPSNVVVDGGVLKIRAQRDGNQFTSARVKTEDKVSFTYGVLEAWIKVPDMEAGLWPAFWTMGSNFYTVGWPKSGEIDIMEMGQGKAINEGKVNRRVVSAAHWDIFGQYATYARSFDANVDLNQAYHNYTMEWTPDKIVTYVDGNWIWEIDIGQECPSCAELHQPHHILLSMAVGGGFTSGGSSSSAASSSSSGCGGSSSAGAASSGGCTTRGPDDITAPFPGEYLIDWVRLYDTGSTQLFVNTPAPTPNPTPLPTPRPSPAPILAVTNAPVLAVTTAPVLPATQPPVIRQPLPNPVGKGKAGKGGGGSRSNRDPGSTSGKAGKGFSKGVGGGSRSNRDPGATSGGKARGKAGKGFAASRNNRNPTGGKAGKGGKGLWSRSGNTATAGGTQRNTPSDQTVMTPTFSTPTAPSPTNPPTALPATTRQTARPTPRPTNRTPDFEPMQDDEVQTDGDDSEPGRLGPQSLVVEPFSGAVSGRLSYVLSILASGLVALGLITAP